MRTPIKTSTSRGPRRRPLSISEKRRRYDATNRVAAEVILGAPRRHTPFQRDWARRFLARRAEEVKQ